MWKAELTEEPAIDVIGEATDPVQVLLEVGSTRAQVVAIDLPSSGEEPGLCSHLLAEYPEVKVVAVSSEGDRAMWYETGVVEKPLPDPSPQGLTQVVRSLAEDPDPHGGSFMQ